MNELLPDLLWIVIALAGLALAFVVIRFLWRLLAGLMYLGGEAAETVYETGDSDTHSLLKVIITILFPPLLILWIWKALADDHRKGASARLEQKEQQLREHQEALASEKAAREERRDSWQD